MEVLLNETKFYSQDLAVLLLQKMDSDEEIVRKKLVKVWTKILEKYARPAMPLPSVEEIRKELFDVGVDEAVDAVVDEHWFVFSFMIREKIEEKVQNGLARFNLPDFLDDVRIAQNDPGMLAHLREKIKRYIMEDL